MGTEAIKSGLNVICCNGSFMVNIVSVCVPLHNCVEHSKKSDVYMPRMTGAVHEAVHFRMYHIKHSFLFRRAEYIDPCMTLTSLLYIAEFHLQSQE